jgi:hypothetical protein
MLVLFLFLWTTNRPRNDLLLIDFVRNDKNLEAY